MASKPPQEKKGPKLGDAASLWNFTPAPGWSKEELYTLKLCLQKYGIGRWVQILETKLLPGKLIQQLNGATQRLLGQQSLAAYTGLKVDVDRIRADNEAKTDVERKNGLIINAGPNLTKKQKEQLRKESEEKYGLTKEQVAEVDELLAEAQEKKESNDEVKPQPAVDVDLIETPVASLSHEQQLELLRDLHEKMQEIFQLLVDNNTDFDIPEGFSFVAERDEADEPAQQEGNNREAGDAQPADVDMTAAQPLTMEDKENVEPQQQVIKSKAPAAKLEALPVVPKRKRSSAGGRPPAGGGTKRRTGRGRSRQVASTRWQSGSDEEDDDFMHEDHMDGTAGEQQPGFVSEAGLVAELQAMGWEASKAKEALEETGGELEAAIEWLVTATV